MECASLKALVIIVVTVGWKRAARLIAEVTVAMWPRRGHNVAMESVSVATLKSNLSRYLAAVRKGKEIVVTSHRHPIARIVPPQNATIEDLKIIPAKKPVSSIRKIKGVKLDVDLVAELLADRRRR